MFPLPHGWTHYAAGGLMIGSGVVLLFALTGLIGGMSSVYTTTWTFLITRPYFRSPNLVASRDWRLAYATGLVLGAFLWWSQSGSVDHVAVSIPPLRLFLGGILVGYGVRLSRGCTSGHGICGLASLGLPSLAAVLTFMGTAFLTANLWIRLGGS